MLCELCQCNCVYMLGVALASVSVTSVSDSCVNAGLTWSNAICQWRNESVFGKKKIFGQFGEILLPNVIWLWQFFYSQTG